MNFKIYDWMRGHYPQINIEGINWRKLKKFKRNNYYIHQITDVELYMMIVRHETTYYGAAFATKNYMDYQQLIEILIKLSDRPIFFNMSFRNRLGSFPLTNIIEIGSVAYPCATYERANHINKKLFHVFRNEKEFLKWKLSF